MWKWLFLLLALALVGVGGFVYLWAVRHPGPLPSGPKALPVSADVIPAGVALYASARVSELWGSPHFALLRDAPKEGPIDALTKAFGLVEVDMGEIDAATYVVPTDPKLPHVMVAAGRKPFDPVAAARRLGLEMPGPSRPVVYSSKRGAWSFAEVEGLLVHVKGTGKGLSPEQWVDLFRRSLAAHRRADNLRAECAAPVVFALSGDGVQQAAPVPVRGPDHFASYRNFLKLETGVVAVSFGDALAIRARGRFPDGATAAAAKAQGGELPQLLKHRAVTMRHNSLDRGPAGTEAAALPELVARLAEKLKVEARGAELLADGEVPVPPTMKAALAALRRDTEEADRRATAVARFQEIGIAAVRFAERSDYRLPNNIYGAGDTPLLSWRVAILPDLGYEALYKEFRLQEPWDSEHNKQLLTKMPDEFSLPGVAAPGPGHSFVQGFIGPAGSNPRPVFVRGDRQGISLDIPDGTSNTALCVESAEAVPWTKPEDLEFDPKKPLPTFGGHYGRRAILLLLDGSARLAPQSNFTESAVRGLATINGNERFEFP